MYNNGGSLVYKLSTCLEKDQLFNKPTLRIFELLPWFFYLVKDEARSRTTTWHNNPFSLKVFRNKTCAFTDPCHREVSNSDCSHHRFTITESKSPYFRNFATFSKKRYIVEIPQEYPLNEYKWIYSDQGELKSRNKFFYSHMNHYILFVFY